MVKLLTYVRGASSREVCYCFIILSSFLFSLQKINKTKFHRKDETLCLKTITTTTKQKNFIFSETPQHVLYASQLFLLLNRPKVYNKAYNIIFSLSLFFMPYNATLLPVVSFLLVFFNFAVKRKLIVFLCIPNKSYRNVEKKFRKNKKIE